jgi:TonB-linked SusC/RagA family outer membrane protein
MKLTVIILLMACLQVSAKGNAQLITYSGTDVSLKTVLTEIKKQSGFAVLCNYRLLQNAKKVTIQVKDASVEAALTEALKGQDLDFSIEDKMIVIVPKPASPKPMPVSPSPPVRITGKVTDADGRPLLGANVKIKGTNIGTTTDSGGNFSLTAPERAVELEVSYVGYVTKTVAVSGNNVAIALEPFTAVNQEVVVTALGISKDSRKLGYAVTKVDGGLLNQAKEPNMAYSLEGRVPGLNISGDNGGPGGSASILIRGISNFTASTGPLIIIDGVPMDNNNVVAQGTPGVYGGSDQGDGISSINSDDIENIVVLKGSTASALYGVRAANGVIQITTKSGKGKRGFGVEFNSNTSLSSIINSTDFQKVYGHGINGIRPQSAADLTIDDLYSWGEKYDGAPVIEQDGQLHPYKAVNHQQDKFYRLAPVTTNTLSFVNGGENGNMRFSFSYMDNNSVVPNSGLKRYTANLNINQNITDRLKLTLVNNYIDETATLRSFLNDKSRNPNFTMKLLPGDIDPDYLKPGYNPINGYENAMSSDGYTPNPWFIVNKTINNTEKKRLISSSVLRYDVLKELYVQGRVGLDLLNEDALNIEPTGIGYNRLGSLQGQTKATTSELNLDALAGYSHNFFKDIDLDASIGGSIRKFNYTMEGTSGNQWKQPFLYTVSNLVTTTPIYIPSQLQTNSEYYTLDLGFRHLLTLSTTGRYDVFSTLPAGNRSIFTPSASASFMFSNLVHIPNLSYGKLRMSYAETSGEATPYQTSVYYQVQPLTDGGLPYGNILDQVANIHLKPYRLKEFEIGMELKGFQNRVGLDLSYFHRRTAGELISKQITIASGYDYSYEPLGSTQNQGVELMLTGSPVKTRDFAWNISFNLTKVSNKLVTIDGTANPAPIQTGQYRPSVGPYNNGAFIAGVQGLPLSQIMAYDYQYDTKGDIVIGGNGIPLRGNLRPMGSGLPKGYGGLNDEFIYKRFNLAFLIDYKFGNKILSATDFFSYYYGLNKATLAGRDNGIVARGVMADGSPNTTIVDAQTYYQGLVTNVSTFSVFDGSFVKLRQITFGYTFTPATLNKTPFESINIAAVARNLLTLVKHTRNFDPEDAFSPVAGYAGLEGIGIPQTRTYGVNLNFKFKK